jgi:Ca2+-binding EF-hand superfamily protein
MSSSNTHLEHLEQHQHTASIIPQSQSQPILHSNSIRRGSYFGFKPATTSGQRRELALQKNSASLKLSKRNKATHQALPSDSQPITKLKPRLLTVKFVEVKRGRPESLHNINPDLEQEIEEELLKKDAHFVMHRRKLLDGPQISEPPPPSTKRRSKKQHTKKQQPVVLVHDQEAARLNLQILSNKATSKESERIFLSPLITYMVQDPSYTLSPARQRTQRTQRPSTAGQSRRRVRSTDSMHAEESATKSLLKLIQKLKNERDEWKKRFRKEAEARSTICHLGKELHAEKQERRHTEQKMYEEQTATTNIMSRKIKESQEKAVKASKESKEWRLRYTSEALFQVNTALACQVVNCGYRKLALSHKQEIAGLKQQVHQLRSRVTTLVKQAHEFVLKAALAPDEQPNPMNSGFCIPLNLSSLPPVESMRKRGGGKGPVKPWSLKRTLREIAALLSSKLDSDLRSDVNRTLRLSLPVHFRSYYLNLKGTMVASSQELAKMVKAIMKHQEGADGSPLVKLVAAMLGLTHHQTYNARSSHTMLGLLARLAIGEYGESAIQATSKQQGINGEQETKVSIGSVLRVVLLRAALNGEQTIHVSLDLCFRMIRYSFPLLMSKSRDDRLSIDLTIREKMFEAVLTSFQVKDKIPFLQALRYETKKMIKKQRKEYVRKKNQEFATPDKNSQYLSSGGAGGRAGGGAGGGAVAGRGSGGSGRRGTLANDTVDNDDDDDGDDEDENNIDSMVEKHERSEMEKELMRRVQEDIPDKTRKLLLTVADNSTALRNLFAIFDEDNSGGVSGEELRIALSQFGILLNRKETKQLIEIVDQDGDGELQFTELLDFVDAISKDEARRHKEIQAKEWNDAQTQLRQERREARTRRRLKQQLAATKNGNSASQFFNFVNAKVEEDSEDSSESDTEDDDGAVASVEDVVEQYLEVRKSHSVEAPLFDVLAACLRAFNRQEAENASRLLAFYRKYDVNKDMNLDFEEFTVLMQKLLDSCKQNMTPEEISELYIESATLTPDNTRVDDQKFLLVMMSKGLVPSPFEDL